MDEKREFNWRTPVIAIDFDGCLCKDEYPEIGKPNWSVIKEALRLQKSGACLILWTCRAGKELEDAVAACRGWGLEFDAINENPRFRIERFKNDCRKVGADEYWDDRAVYMGMPGSFRTIRGASVQTKPVIGIRKFIDEALRPEIESLREKAHLEEESLGNPTGYYGASMVLQECLERMELLLDMLEERGTAADGHSDQ